MIFDKIEIIPRKIISDNRGWFLKVITGKESNLPQFTGEFYVTSAKPNESKGGHYHFKANEWFTLIKGECKLIIEDIYTKERVELLLNANIPKTIYVPVNLAHIFVNNSSDDFILAVYTDELYDKGDTITYSF